MALQKFPLMGLLMLLTIVVSTATADGPVCPPSTKLSRASFPEGFLFGTATAAYQVEGAVNETCRGPALWDIYCKRYPDGRKEKGVSQAGVQFYHDVIDELLRNADGPVCPPSTKLSRASFPEGFLFGTATAAYQVEGAVNETCRGPALWDIYCKRYPEKCKNDNGDVAVDFFHRYKEDIQLMKNLNTDAFRLSIAWTRIFPHGRKEKGVSQAGVQFYHDVIDELLRNACSRVDLSGIHELLEKLGYGEDDVSVTNEFSFQMWTGDLQENTDYKKHGDAAFRAKDFETAIEFYTEFMSGAPVVSPTVLIRRCLCYLMSDMFSEALSEAMQAQVVSPECSTALYLQAACLLKLGMEAKAKEALQQGSALEAV
ncbi:hypothetical protein F2Q68_00018069 [Brassica cretica]|uniref:Serine/threonine-protein kinase BSK n=1 Tax=Brassica cretica TaxID=69181 RepID=A0A8S9HHZ4_BRACR|nr:hypothetical protein F2Q68_00018069 [Brassica cretica]